MRLSSPVVVAAIGAVLLGRGVCAEAAGLDRPLSQLEALGLPFECATVREGRRDREIRDLSKAHAAEVQHLAFDSGTRSFDETPQLPNEVFDILPRFPNLCSLRFDSYLIDPHALRRLRSLPKLLNLEMHCCRSRADATFRKPADLDFVGELPSLESLRLTSCGLTDEMVARLAPQKSLKRLNLSNNERITEASLPTFEQMTALERLGLSYTRWNPPKMVERRFAAKFKSFSSSPSLARREPPAPFTLEEIREILTLPRRIWGWVHPTEAPLAEVVSLLPGPVTSVQYQAYGETIAMTGIDANSDPFHFSVGKTLTDEDLVTIGKMSELRSLKIETSSPYLKDYELGFTDAGLSSLTGLKNLEQLSILVDQFWVAPREQPYYLTTQSLTALAEMPALTSVVLSPVNLGGDSLAWAKSTPELKTLELHNGMVSGDAFADLAEATALRRLWLGYADRSVTAPKCDISISRPTRPFSVDNVTDLRLRSRHLFVDGMEAVSRMRSLTSLTLDCPLTDTHMKQLASLRQLRRFSCFKGEDAELPLTTRGVMRLRQCRGHLDLHTPVLVKDSSVEQAMADQFDWFIDWGCGCCGSEAMPGVDWWPADIENGRLRPIDNDDQGGRLKREKPKAVRIRGPLTVEQLTIAKSDLPPSVDTLCLTDCRIDRLHFDGWMPRSIRVWGNSRIHHVDVSDIPDKAETELAFYFLEGEQSSGEGEEYLNVPGFKHLSRIVVAECELRTIRLEGDFPDLKSVKFSDSENLSYFIASYGGQAPKLDYPRDLDWVARLPALQTLNLAGTAIGSTLPVRNAEPASDATSSKTWFPPRVSYVDLSNTSITDEWLEELAKLPNLRYLKIGGCTELSEEGKAAFQESRPKVKFLK